MKEKSTETEGQTNSDAQNTEVELRKHAEELTSTNLELQTQLESVQAQLEESQARAAAMEQELKDLRAAKSSAASASTKAVKGPYDKGKEVQVVSNTS